MLDIWEEFGFSDDDTTHPVRDALLWTVVFSVGSAYGFLGYKTVIFLEPHIRSAFDSLMSLRF